MPGILQVHSVVTQALLLQAFSRGLIERHMIWHASVRRTIDEGALSAPAATPPGSGAPGGASAGGPATPGKLPFSGPWYSDALGPCSHHCLEPVE